MSELDEHRITRIKTLDLISRYPRTVGKNARLGSHGSGITSPAAVVYTDRGAAGWGLLRPVRGELSRLIGRTVGEVLDPSEGVTAEEALPLDFALHDLAGVILRRPVFDLLGAAGPRVVPCYDGAIYMDDLDPEDAPRGIDVVLANCAHDHALGYRAFKLKIGRGFRWAKPEIGLERDIAVTRTVRQHYPGCTILVDANDGYTYEQLIQYLDGVADCDLFWIEEPFPESRAALEGLRRYLSAHSPRTLVADGEAHPDVPFLLELAREGLVDVLLMDVVGLGLTTWRRLMPALRELGVRASPHAWGDPLKTLYAAQIATGLGNVITVEGVPGFAEAIDCTGYVLEDGLLTVPDLPGWGISPPRAPIR